MDNLDWLGPTWSASQWPDWVPQAIRQEIEAFWSERCRRSPQAWADSQECERAPAFGTDTALPLFSQYKRTWVYAEGRYVHAWNNIGRIVHADGTWSYVWLPRRDLEPRVTIATAMDRTELEDFAASHVVGKETP